MYWFLQRRAMIKLFHEFQWDSFTRRLQKGAKIQSPQRRICHCVHCWYNAFLLDWWRVVVACCKGGGCECCCFNLLSFTAIPQCKEHMSATRTSRPLSWLYILWWYEHVYIVTYMMYCMVFWYFFLLPYKSLRLLWLDLFFNLLA